MNLLQLSDIRREVKHVNIEDTSEIDDIVPQRGAPGAVVSIKSLGIGEWHFVMLFVISLSAATR